jgi:LPPG:FO 2-phospho-L-lactate transferase
LIIGPSNPILSVWPILAVPGISEAVAGKERVVAVSPLIAGAALKGPAHQVLSGLGYGVGTKAVIDSYGGLLTDILIDNSDADDAAGATNPRVHLTETRMPDLAASTRLAQSVLDAIGRPA